jgi:SAM-dependent methyltransferase
LVDATALNKHYGVDVLEERAMAVLKENGLDRDGIGWQDLSRFDQFHTGGLGATLALAELLAPEAGQAGLDIGSGLGGPARAVAATYGCRMIGVDLNPTYVRVASEFSRRSGLAEQTTFVEANALAMPFADGAFDFGMTQHTAMNIPDRIGLYTEIRRVLKPGAKLAIHDVVLGNGQPLEFPFPWASRAELSAVVSVETMDDALRTAGFREVVFRDATEDAKAFFAQNLAGPDPTTGKPPANLVALIGAEFAPLLGNYAKHVADGRLRVIQTIQEAV